jgi:hypothetical protein
MDSEADRSLRGSAVASGGIVFINVGFDMGEPTGLRIGYAEVICYKFGLLDT